MCGPVLSVSVFALSVYISWQLYFFKITRSKYHQHCMHFKSYLDTVNWAKLYLWIFKFCYYREQIFRAVIKAEYPGPKLEWISSTAPSRHIRHCRRYLPQSSINLSVYGSLAWIWLMFEIKFHTTAHKCTVQTLCYRKRQSGSLPLRKGR